MSIFVLLRIDTLKEGRKIMEILNFGCYGVNGHQIFGLMSKIRGARIIGIGGVSDEEYEKLSKQYPQITKSAKRYETLEDMLKDDDIHIISLCSPRRDQQASHVLQAIRAGKHVLAEKPMAINMDELNKIKEVYRKSNVHIRSMLGALYEPHFDIMKRIVNSGKLGEVVQVFAQKSYPYHEKRPQDPGIDGGLIMQAGIHAVTFIRWVTSLEFTEIFAYQTKHGNPMPGNLQMAASASFKLNNGGLGSMVVNYLNPRRFSLWGNDQLRIYGTEGMVEAVDGCKRMSVTTNTDKRKELKVPEIDPSQYLQEYVNLVLQGTPMRLTVEDCFINTEVVIKAQQSADEGKPVMI